MQQIIYISYFFVQKPPLQAFWLAYLDQTLYGLDPTGLRIGRVLTQDSSTIGVL